MRSFQYDAHSHRSIYEFTGAIFPSQVRYLYDHATHRMQPVFNDPPTVMGIPARFDTRMPLYQIYLTSDPIPHLTRMDEIERATFCSTPTSWTP